MKKERKKVWLGHDKIILCLANICSKLSCVIRFICPKNIYEGNFLITKILSLVYFHSLRKVMIFFLIAWNCSFFMGITFCSSIPLISTFNTRGVHDFITRKANIPVYLVPLFKGVLFLFCLFSKSGVTNELKCLFLLKSKKVRVVYSKQGKTLLLVKR